jgi:hypothetical protein
MRSPWQLWADELISDQFAEKAQQNVNFMECVKGQKKTITDAEIWHRGLALQLKSGIMLCFRAGS